MMTRRASLYGFVALLLFAVLALTMFFYENNLASAKHQALSAAESSFIAQRVELARDRAVVKRVSFTSEQVKNVPQKRDESSLIRELSQTAVQTGAQVQSLTFNSSSGKQGNDTNGTKMNGSIKNVVSLQVIAAGTTKQLLDFIDSLQTNARLVIVKDCDISVDSSRAQITAQLDFPYSAQG